MALRHQIEILALVAVARQGAEAYGVAIHDDIEQIAGRAVSLAGVYSALDRLERDGLVRAALSAPRAERGGRARRVYGLTSAGRQHLQKERELALRMWADPAAEGPGKRR